MTLQLYRPFMNIEGKKNFFLPSLSPYITLTRYFNMYCSTFTIPT